MSGGDEEGARLLRAPTLPLRGALAERWIRTLVAALRAARLNTHWPDVRRLADHVDALDPDVHHGLYGGVEIDPRSGLPSYRDLTRVVTDRAIADDALGFMGEAHQVEARAAARPQTVHGRQLLKHRYYSALHGRRLAPLGDLHVALRRIDLDTRTAHFNVVLDKLDASGLYVRYSVDMAQQDDTWDRPLVGLDDEHAQHTEALRATIYRSSSMDAELTFVKLAAEPQLTVERVVKGTVGPIWMGCCKEARQVAPPSLQPLLADQDAFVAGFGLDMAAVDLAADRDNDPLERLLADRLSEQARAEYQAARRRYGFKVFKDRKLVVPRALQAQVRGWCAERGTRNVVYCPRGARPNPSGVRR